ncbi:MAG: TolC family protein [Bacteroidetes bacterium]|nr:TolC family protein [Bacteroidota bacterium]
MNYKAYIIALILFATTLHSQGDSLRLTLDGADSLFLKNSLPILSAKYAISAAEGQRIQAKLYPNPNIYYEQSLLNKYTRKHYDSLIEAGHLPQTEIVLNVQQTILIAGKRNKQIKIAAAGVKMAKADFENLIRTLRFTLRSDLSNLYYNIVAINLLNYELKSMLDLQKALNNQVAKGFISLNEATRVKSMVFDIEKQINDLNTECSNLYSEINTIINLPAETIVRPLFSSKTPANVASVKDFIDSSMVNNPDIKKGMYFNEQNKATFEYNRSLAYPDLTLQFSYDQAGNYIPYYFGFGVGLNLPTFNRNQGSIKTSRYQLMQSQNDLKQQQLTVSAQIISNYTIYKNTVKMLDNYKGEYEKNLLYLLDQLLINYKNRVISLNEFSNYFDSYKQNYLDILNTKTNYYQSIEQLNYLIGKPLIKYE